MTPSLWKRLQRRLQIRTETWFRRVVFKCDERYTSLNYSTWPGSNRDAENLRAYVERGVFPGEFLWCVLRNDLRGAIVKCEREPLPSIIPWLEGFIPGSCWGSPRAVAEWMQFRGGARANALIHPRITKEENTT